MVYDTSDTTISWSREQTMLLLDLCIEHKDNICDRGSKKKNVWHDIASAMASKGVKVSRATCERKLCNLKQTYKNIKDNNGRMVAVNYSTDGPDSVMATYRKTARHNK